MQRDSVAQTFKIATLLCLVCSLLVSGAAVGLRTKIGANKEREKRKNILKAAGLWNDGGDVDTLFQSVEKKLIDLNTGQYVDVETVDPELYDQKKAAHHPELSSPIKAKDDIATLKRREHYSFVYLVKGSDNTIDQVVLPIRGYGLWSTLYGFLALDAKALQKGNDEKIIRGLAYYQHGETPGLGGEVDNENWKAKWQGKQAFDKEWNVVIEVAKPPHREPDRQVDALSGATITSQGVTNMLRYWLGDEGFGPYLKMLKAELSGHSETTSQIWEGEAPAEPASKGRPLTRQKTPPQRISQPVFRRVATRGFGTAQQELRPPGTRQRRETKDVKFLSGQQSEGGPGA